MICIKNATKEFAGVYRKLYSAYMTRKEDLLMKFEFIMPPKVVFGRGEFEKLPGFAAQYGQRLLVCASKSLFQKYENMNGFVETLKKQHVELYFYHGAGSGVEPTPEMVDEAAGIAREAVLAIGGGSVMDIGKAAAAVAANPGCALDYIEGVGNRKFTHAPLPFLAVPTTSGTGSEATKNSVIAQSGRFKNSIRDDRMMARVALIDPLLTLQVPAHVTAASGADAVCQLIESYTTAKPNYFTDALCLPRIAPAIAALKAAYADGSNIDAREEMAISASAASAWQTPGSGSRTALPPRLEPLRGSGTGSPAGY